MAKKNDSEHLQPDTKVEKFERQLLVKLTDKEKAELAERAAHLFGEIEQKTEEIKASAKQAKAQVEEIKAEHKRVNMEYREGSRYSPVRCERRINFRTGVVQEVRLDTGEVLHERPLNERERQLSLTGTDGADSDDDVSFIDDEVEEEPELPTARKRGRKSKANDTEAEAS